MSHEDHYVVRIYRRTQNPDGLTGIVEHPGSGLRAAFHDIQELRSALVRKPPPRQPATARKPARSPGKGGTREQREGAGGRRR